MALRPRVETARRRWDRWDGLILGYALLAAVFQPLTVQATVAVLVPGLALLAAAVLRRTPPAPASPRSGPAVGQWLALAVAGALWWLVAFAWGNDPAHPTLSLLLDPVLETYPARVLGYAAWLAAGRWLVTR